MPAGGICSTSTGTAPILRTARCSSICTGERFAAVARTTRRACCSTGSRVTAGCASVRTTGSARSVRYPDQLIDAKKVIAWIREHGNEHGAGSEIVVAGSSAGANLAAALALTPNEPHLQPGFERADTSVAAAVCLYGYYGSYGGDSPLSSPLAHIHADAPPFFVAHGDRDTLVLVGGRSRICRGASQCLDESRRLRRTARCAAHVRPLPLTPLRASRRRYRGVCDRGAPCGQRAGLEVDVDGRAVRDVAVDRLGDPHRDSGATVRRWVRRHVRVAMHREPA